MELWIVGQVEDEDKTRVKQWGFQGVFDSESRAIAACRNDAYFIGPAILNEELPDEIEEWPGAYYPLLENDSVCEASST